MPAESVVVTDLTKTFRLPHERHSSLKQTVLNVGRRTQYERLDVLRGLSFSIKQGEFFGIVGRNGSGKSTLLKTLAGIYTPTSGRVEVNGFLTPFIELGVGFNPELTGRDNVFLNGVIFGMSHKQVEQKYDEIVSFAELEKFMDQKLKNYSSGMQVRLAFSIAIQAQSEILLLDEVLAVGDAVFQQKCFTYFKELKKAKKTVIFVSHDSGALQEYCDNGILIEKGKIIEKGPIDNVVKSYLRLLNDDQSQDAGPADKKRWGRGDVRVLAGETLTVKGTKKTVFGDDDKLINICVTYEGRKQVEEPVYGITITSPSGERIFQSNTLWNKTLSASLAAKERAQVIWSVPNIFNSGEFLVAPAVADRSGVIIYDWYDDLIKFQVRKNVTTSAHANVDHIISIKPVK